LPRPKQTIQRQPHWLGRSGRREWSRLLWKGQAEGSLSGRGGGGEGYENNEFRNPGSLGHSGRPFALSIVSCPWPRVLPASQFLPAHGMVWWRLRATPREIRPHERPPPSPPAHQSFLR
jgi:hypothetical protein